MAWVIAIASRICLLRRFGHVPSQKHNGSRTYPHTPLTFCPIGPQCQILITQDAHSLGLSEAFSGQTLVAAQGVIRTSNRGQGTKCESAAAFITDSEATEETLVRGGNASHFLPR